MTPSTPPGDSARASIEDTPSMPAPHKVPSLPLTPSVLLMVVVSLLVSAVALFAAGVLTGVTLSAPGAALASLHGTTAELPKTASVAPIAPVASTTESLASPPIPVEDTERQPILTPAPASLAAYAGTENGSYTLQAGAFEAASRAEDRRQAIESLGLPTRQAEIAMNSGRVLHVVLVGHYPSPSAADQARQALARVGIDAALTTVD